MDTRRSESVRWRVISLSIHKKRQVAQPRSCQVVEFILYFGLNNSDNMEPLTTWWMSHCIASPNSTYLTPLFSEIP